MIRDAVLHLLNEQPLIVDLFERPAATDAGLVCTNVRTTAGTRPAFVDRVDSTFFFPYTQVRFLEIFRERLAGAGEAVEAPQTTTAESEELELDEDMLRRIREA